jgi:hypothetical protein
VFQRNVLAPFSGLMSEPSKQRRLCAERPQDYVVHEGTDKQTSLLSLALPEKQNETIRDKRIRNTLGTGKGLYNLQRCEHEGKAKKSAGWVVGMQQEIRRESQEGKMDSKLIGVWRGQIQCPDSMLCALCLGLYVPVENPS